MLKNQNDVNFIKTTSQKVGGWDGQRIMIGKPEGSKICIKMILSIQATERGDRIRILKSTGDNEKYCK